MPIAQDLIIVAQLEVGTGEMPPGSGITKYGLWFGAVGGSWQTVFACYCVSYTFLTNNAPLGMAEKGSAYAPDVFAMATRAGWVATDPRPGDVAFYDLALAAPNRCGIIESIAGNNITLIQGDSGPTDDARGQVARRVYPMGYMAGFVRPLWTSGGRAAPVCPEWTGRFLQLTIPPLAGGDVLTWQTQMIAQGASRLTASGTFDEASRATCLELQRTIAVPMTGIVGPIEWRAAWVAPAANLVFTSV